MGQTVGCGTVDHSLARSTAASESSLVPFCSLLVGVFHKDGDSCAQISSSDVLTRCGNGCVD